ncbi:MAG: tRNA pseudouridine(55) synthase TruB [Oscillospiraceae bacterium]|nr:tRNA pseudouridine(55) synthase TruB [Oscillospiraceae bacterium]
MKHSGILIIDKPASFTSHDVVAKLRAALRIKRVGHGGTLDPMATGVLPVFIGRATRAAQFCENAEKEYIAGLRLGIVTDTQDITGTALSDSPHTAGICDVRAVLPLFLGEQKQLPPMYSAIKIGGKKLYELARRGVEIEREARDITISKIELIEPSKSALCREEGGDFPGGDIFLRIVCSKGTYIRTLCHDIGAKLGCGGAMSYLRRTRVGAYSADAAHTLKDALSSILSGSAGDILCPVDSMFSRYPSIILSEADAQKVKNGARPRIKSTEQGRVASGVREESICEAPGVREEPCARELPVGRYKVYAPNGEFLLIGELKNGELITIKSFFEV